MGEVNNTLTIYLPSRGEDIDIDVSCVYEVLNDGIGEYEYWGQKGVDGGRDYPVITDTEWNKTGFTSEDIILVERAIEEALEKWEIEIDNGDTEI